MTWLLSLYRRWLTEKPDHVTRALLLAQWITDLRATNAYPRRYRHTLPRHPKRDPEVIKRDLGTAYVAHRRQELGTDISAIVSLRTYTLRLVDSRRRA